MASSEQLRALGENVRIDVADFITLFSNEIGSLTKKFQTRNALVPVVGVRKHFADITEAAGTKQSIGDGVAENIAI